MSVVLNSSINAGRRNHDGESRRVTRAPTGVQGGSGVRDYRGWYVNRQPLREDPIVTALAKKISKLAVTMAIVAIVRNVVLLYLQYYDISMIEMLLPLMIPYCGYEGSRRKNRALINCFWGCSAFILTLYILNLMFSVNYFIQVGKKEDHVHGINVNGQIAHLITGGIAAMLQGLACVWGRQLSHTDYMLYVSHAAQHGDNIGNHVQREVINADGTVIYVTNMGAVSAVSHPIQSGISRAQLNSFSSETLNDDALATDDWGTKGKSRTCVICLDDFVSGSTVKTLPCGHIFHKNCIDQWLGGHTRCPNCNHDCNESHV